MSLNIKGRSINGVFYRAEIGNKCRIDISIIGYADFYGKFLSGANSPDTLLKKRNFFRPLEEQKISVDVENNANLSS
jgi:hypothetical protein